MLEPSSSLAAGAVLGLSAGLAPGPLLTLVITQALRHNAREGAIVAVAPLVTDLPIILASLLLLGPLERSDPLMGAICLAGSLYVLHLAWASLRAHPARLEACPEQPRSLRKGIWVNALNPHPYLFWTTVGGPFLIKGARGGPLAPVLFLLGFYVCLVGSKILIALGAGRSQRFLKGRLYTWVLHGLALLLVLFAAFLFRDALSLLGPWFS